MIKNIDDYVKYYIDRNEYNSIAIKVWLAEKLLNDKIITTTSEYFKILNLVIK